MACPTASRWATTGGCWSATTGFILSNAIYPESRAEGGRRDSQDHPAFGRPLPGMDRGLQRRQAGRVELRLGRAAGGVGAAGQRGLARATPGRPDALQAALGLRRAQVHQPGRGQQVSSAATIAPGGACSRRPPAQNSKRTSPSRSATVPIVRRSSATVFAAKVTLNRK